MLILLPPSETKDWRPGAGPPLELSELAFPELTTTRRRVAEALVATSALADGTQRLTLPPGLASEAAGNVELFTMPTMPAIERYTGDLYEALSPRTLSPAARRRAADRVVIVSSLWGAVRPDDLIPPYRLPICAALTGMDGLEATWRPELGPVLAEAAGADGLVIDMRSSSYRAVGSPSGLADRTLVVRIVSGVAPGARSAAPVIGKRVRGELVRQLLESGADPATPADLVAALSPASISTVRPPTRPGQPSTLDVVTPAT